MEAMGLEPESVGWPGTPELPPGEPDEAGGGWLPSVPPGTGAVVPSAWEGLLTTPEVSAGLPAEGGVVVGLPGEAARAGSCACRVPSHGKDVPPNG
jgi:hypothetical protein